MCVEPGSFNVKLGGTYSNHWASKGNSIYRAIIYERNYTIIISHTQTHKRYRYIIIHTLLSPMLVTGLRMQRYSYDGACVIRGDLYFIVTKISELMDTA